jgi:hypothetical protein
MGSKVTPIGNCFRSDQDPEYPTSPHWVKKIYKNDENRIPLKRVGWVFFNPER